MIKNNRISPNDGKAIENGFDQEDNKEVSNSNEGKS